MVRLSSDAGHAALHAFVSTATLFAFDLDGTLAPIVDDPADIRISGAVRNGMAALTSLAATAVITGRSRSDAAAHLEFSPRYLVGNHGAEGLPGQEETSLRLRRTVSAWEEQLASRIGPELREAILLERKTYSLSLHYRHAPYPRSAHAALLTAIAGLEPPPRRVGGKFVENIIPAGAPHKGDALLRLLDISGCANAFFIGDDETDEDVFRLDDPRIFSVCVGGDRPTAARYLLDRQEDIAPLLHGLVNLLAREPLEM